MIDNVSRFLNLKDNDFFFSPLPKKDELLSSWLIRVAYKHFTNPSSFLNIYFPEYGTNTLFRRDIDIWANKQLLNKIAIKSKINYNIIFNTTLKSYESNLCEKITYKTRNPLILTLGNYADTKYNHGLKYCPLCLKEEEPYYRKKWRLSFYNVCTKHKIFLNNKCWNCNTSINITRLYQKEYKFNYCYKCGTKLDLSKVEYCQDDDLLITNILCNALDNGYLMINKKPIYSIFYFLILKHLSHLILNAWKRGKVTDIKYFQYNKFNPNRRVIFENDYSIKELHYAFKEVVLTIREPRFLRKMILNYKIFKSDLTKDMKYIPFWYENLLNEI